jgi:spermidine export protein MdtJ
MYHWSFMFLAIFAEVCGTLAMKYSADGMRTLGMGVMYFMLIISYTSLAIAVKRIPLVVAYGAWESLGLALIAILSHILFSEPLGFIKIMGILIIISGIVLMEYGTDGSAH